MVDFGNARVKKLADDLRVYEFCKIQKFKNIRYTNLKHTVEPKKCRNVKLTYTKFQAS